MFHPTWEIEVDSKIQFHYQDFRRNFRPFRRELLRTAVMERMISEAESIVLEVIDRVDPVWSAAMAGSITTRNVARWFLQNDKARIFDALYRDQKRARRCFDDYDKAVKQAGKTYLNPEFLSLAGTVTSEWNEYPAELGLPGDYAGHWEIAKKSNPEMF